VSGPLVGSQLNLRVTPKASRNEVAGLHVDANGAMSLNVKVTAVPDKGKANKAVIEVLARAMMVPKSTFSLVKGHTDRNKTLQIIGPIHPIEAFLALLRQAGHTHGENH
jgi:uncharacterized protein (TIGR00251 family)